MLHHVAERAEAGFDSDLSDTTNNRGIDKHLLHRPFDDVIALYSRLQRLHIDDTEFSCLKALALFKAGISELQSYARIISSDVELIRLYYSNYGILFCLCVSFICLFVCFKI